MQLRTLQDWVVRPRLLRVQGVADVVSYGGLVREIHVQPSPAKLAASASTLEDLERARQGVAQRQRRLLERGAEQFVIRSLGLFTHARRHRARRRSPRRDGTPVLVRDVAAVADG